MSAAARVARALAASKAEPLIGYQRLAPGAGGMSPAQGVFHRDPARLRWIIAGTQVGKTRAGCAEAWWHALGRHPFREVPAVPDEGWIMTPDLEGDWPKISDKLREIEPAGALHPRCTWDRARGYRYASERLVVLRNGSVMRPKSGTQALQTLEGATIPWLWVDEVPREAHWYAGLQRIVAKHGNAWATFTAVGRPAGWMRDYLEGNHETGQAPAEGWSKHRIKLTPENVPHRPPSWVDDQIALMNVWDIPQRRDAEWDGVAPGRRFPSWRPEHVIDIGALMGMEFDRFRIGMDHGEGVGKQVVYLVGFAGRRVVVISEWCSKSLESGAREVAHAIRDMLSGMSLSVHDLERMVGDINTAGLAAGGGLKFNLMVEAELRKALGLRALPLAIDPPHKRRGSVLAGESAMNAAMKDGEFLVHETCQHFTDAVLGYTGKEAGLKDKIDGVRYAVEDVLLDESRRIYTPQPMVVTL